MKTSIAKITLVLWTSKVLKDGTSPIMLAVRFNGQSLLSTHFSCKEKDWDKKNECLKKTFPNYAATNKILTDLKNKAIAVRLKFESDDNPYTSKMIIEGMQQKDYSGASLKFEDVMNKLIKDRHLKTKTILSYKVVFEALSKFLGKKDFILTELTNEVVISFAKDNFNRLGNTNSVISYNSKIASVINYANENELTQHCPKKAFAWIAKNYKKTTNHKALDEIHFENVRAYYFTMPKDKLFDRNSKVFALAFYLSSYTLFGLAPVDCAKLKINMIENITINCTECWKITTTRSKTNENCNIIVRKDSPSADIIRPFIESANERDGYIFPILRSNEGKYHYKTEKQEISNISFIEVKINKHLKKIAEELQIPKFTLYSARHSFASHQIKNGRNIGNVAQAMGRSIEGIGCYIKNLMSDNDYLSMTVF